MLGKHVRLSRNQFSTWYQPYYASPEKSSQGEQVYIGDGATEHMLLGDSVINALEAYSASVLATMAVIRGEFSIGGQSLGNMGLPVVAPGLDVAVELINNANTALLKALRESRSTVARLK